MKFKLRQFRRNLSLKLSENFYLFKKRIRKSWDQFIDKGHEKMTIMFIPHNERKIFNFQISKFTITFFIFLFLIIIATSSYAYFKNNAIKREERRLLMTYEDIRSNLIRFEKLSSELNSNISDLKPEIEELYELATGTDEIENIWNIHDFDAKGLAELKKLSRILPDGIFTIKDNQKDMLSTTNTIKTIRNFINVRNKVKNDTPSIVSNQGHITSLFGWRRSPFGHGRDFHTGIDIAAASGTRIKATAPGTVVTAGWGGGYGFMIRIKHKYGFETIYAHCKKLYVRAGRTVKKGQVIATVGMTGNTTGFHCHYEIRLGGMPINPYPYMSRVW